MKYSIYCNDCNHDMLLTSSSNMTYKYLWSDIDTINSDKNDKLFIHLGAKKDEQLVFDSAEETFSFIEENKNNFAYSNKCFVIVQK